MRYGPTCSAASRWGAGDRPTRSPNSWRSSSRTGPRTSPAVSFRSTAAFGCENGGEAHGPTYLTALLLQLPQPVFLARPARPDDLPRGPPPAAGLAALLGSVRRVVGVAGGGRRQVRLHADVPREALLRARRCPPAG